MTWIVGTSTPFGCAGLIADTRVSWSNGVHADVLQKLHPVGRNLMVGFAGSVTLGFRALRHLKRLAAEDHDSGESNPVPLLVRWQGVLQTMVEGDPAHAKDGCQLIAAGFTQRNGELLSECFTMVAPDFEVTSSPPGEWNSIGIGTDYDHARLLLGKRFHEFANSLMQGEVAERSRGPGGYLRAVAFALAHSLFQDPETDVSDLLLVGLVTVNGCILQPQQITFNVGTHLETKRATPTDLCTSLEMLQDPAGQLEVDAGAATAAYSLVPQDVVEVQAWRRRVARTRAFSIAQPPTCASLDSSAPAVSPTASAVDQGWQATIPRDSARRQR